jgi:tetratricopeptide (TPR) repeat protein
VTVRRLGSFLKSDMSTSITPTQTLSLFLAVLLFSAGSAFAQGTACSPLPAHPVTPAEAAYREAKYERAENLYQQALLEKPNDPDLNIALIRTLLHESRISDAATRATKAIGADPRSAATLTALAEVQLREGQPWLASQTLDSATAADPCYARVHLIRSRIFRIDSMYASERVELQAAYQIDPSDPDIQRAWRHTVNPANDIQRIEESLATINNLDPDIRAKAQASVNSMLSLLSENSQTCQSAPITAPVTLPLIPAYENVKQISGYKLAVDFPKGKAKLTIDTAASGLYISQALAEANGFQHAEGAPLNTVEVDSLQIGPLQFRNCMVGVSDTAFAEGVEGFIGTDVFAPYLITLNPPEAKLEVAPFPRTGEAKSILPGDRSVAPDLAGYAPVYHKNQYLLVPVLLNKKDRRLFVLDTGIRLTTMTSEVAHSISNTRVNFTNPVRTVSGATLQIYRDSFNLQFANLSLDRQSHILEFDPSAIDQNAGMEVAGMLGFDILHSLVMHIDYRDGLVKFDSPASGPARTTVLSSQTAAPSSLGNDGSDSSCTQYANQNTDHPLSSTIQGGIVGWLDSGHLKAGQSINVKVVQDWIAPGCTLVAGANLYGHVLTATSSKGGRSSQLAVVFDHADCSGHPKRELSLRIIGVAGGDTQSQTVHNVMPTEVAGGGRAISDTAASMGVALDDNMKPGIAPNIVRPGIVAGMRHLKLLPEGGPQCSAMLISDERSVHLGAGSEFILTMQRMP